MSLENRGGLASTIPLVKELLGLQNNYFKNYELRIQGLSSPEDLLEEQRRLEKKSGIFQKVAWGSVAILGGAVLGMFLNQDIARKIPSWSLVSVGLSIFAIGLGSAHYWWMVDYKQKILHNHFS